METEETENRQTPLSFTDMELFTSIWTSPRLVIRYLNENNYNKYVWFLLIMAGIANALSRAESNSTGDDLSLTAVLLIAILLGGALGWIGNYIYASLLSWTGNWLGGKGNTNSLVRMIAHAMTPAIAMIGIYTVQILYFGNGIFQSEIYLDGTVENLVYYGGALMGLVLGIWTLVIFVIGTSEVQQFSIGNSILNMLLPIFIIVLPIMLIAVLFGA